jgi:4-hydroxy 2-oxovalerate aldolase
MCGYAEFHSSFLKDIYKCCNEKEVDPLRLIMVYSEENKMSMDYERLCQVADSLPKDLEDNPYSFGEYFSARYRE